MSVLAEEVGGVCLGGGFARGFVFCNDDGGVEFDWGLGGGESHCIVDEGVGFGVLDAK
jgi:hypothetical protein